MRNDKVRCANCGAFEVERTKYYKRSVLSDFVQVSRTIELNLGDHGERQVVYSYIFCSPECASDYLLTMIERESEIESQEQGQGDKEPF